MWIPCHNAAIVSFCTNTIWGLVRESRGGGGGRGAGRKRGVVEMAERWLTSRPQIRILEKSQLSSSLLFPSLSHWLWEFKIPHWLKKAHCPYLWRPPDCTWKRLPKAPAWAERPWCLSRVPVNTSRCRQAHAPSVPAAEWVLQLLIFSLCQIKPNKLIDVQNLMFTFTLNRFSDANLIIKVDSKPL